MTCATGTKCTTTGPDGWVLRDCHAEVLCRRGLLRELLEETNGGTLRLLEKRDGSYQLQPDTTLHLYVSDSPCGDASIYPIVNDMNFTGAKVIVRKNNENGQHIGELLPVNDPNATECCVARETTQKLGVLRTKSGRSNLPQHLRSMSMSCSDKLLKWCVLGLQGSWLPFDVRLSSIVVSRDTNATSLEAQQEALERAIKTRVKQVVEELQSQNTEIGLVKRWSEHEITVHVVEPLFPDSKSSVGDDATCTDSKGDESKTMNGFSKKRKRVDDGTLQNNKKPRTQKSPCGVGINWQASHAETEVVVGARGIQQGKKPKSDQDYVKMSSRLSRGALVQLVTKTDNNTNDNQNKNISYRAFKAQRAHPEYAEARHLVFSTRLFQGWMVGTSDFEICQ